ncbi:MAG: alkaline phosphatase family protein [Ktedonobacteraceae bacterium]
MRTVIFGVDGLTFSVLHPLIKQGKLPNFKKLSEQGCEAILESKYPPLTPPAWTSLSTGVKPARHGIYDFWAYEGQHVRGASRKTHILSRRRAEKAIWNILSEYGKQVLVVNVPATYPPETVNGVMVSGYMTPSITTEFTYPTTFKEEIFQVAPDYQIDLEVHAYERLKQSGKVGPIVDAILHMTEQRTKLMLHMLKEQPWDFAYLAYIGADRLQHPLWEEVISLHPRTNQYYEMIDDALGQVLAMLGPDDTLFAISDHGFRGHSIYFDINEYFYQKGLLSFGSTFEASRRKAGRAAQVRQVVTRLGLRSLARKVKKSLKSAGLGLAISGEQGLNRPVLDDIDWDKTRAYVPSLSGFPSGYADIFLSPDMTQAEIAALCDDLKRQRHPKTGRPLIDEAFTTEVYGTGQYAPAEPHLLLLPNDDITFRVELGNERIWEDLGKAYGSHHKNGILYAYGSGIKQNFKAPNAEVYDLVPTVLRSMDLPLPYAFDGRILDELFVEEQKSAEQDTLAAANGTENGMARRKLKKLLEA